MKKFISYTLYAAAALAAVACSKEMIVEKPMSQGSIISFTGTAFEQTKVSVGEKENGVYPLLWQTGDAISIWSEDSVSSVDDEGNQVFSGNIAGEQAQLYSGDAGKHSGVFQTNNPLSVTEDENIVLLYPASSLSYSEGKVTGTVPAKQEQRKENSSIHIGNYAISYAKTQLKAGQTEGVEFSLSQKTAFVKLTLTTSEYASLNLVGAKLYSEGSALSGKMVCDVATGAVSVSETADNVGAVLRTPTAFSGAQDLYFTALPCDLTGKDCYVIITMSDDSKTVTIPAKISGGKLEASKLSVIKVENISAATNTFEWYEPVETRYIAAFGEGWSYGPSNCFVAYSAEDGGFGEAVTFDVKARGNFAKCTKPASLVVFNACEQNPSNKNNLEINGTVCHDGTSYVEIPLNGNYTVTVKAKQAGSYTGYSSKVKLLDENGDCIWAFNIWGNTEQLKEQTYENGVMLDRNIGASSHKGYGYATGSYYQWGRPFQTGWSSSGGMFLGASTNVTDLSISASKPETFFHMKDVTPSQGGDWYLGAHTGGRNEHLDDLWGNQNTTGEEVVSTKGTKSIYDPCPKGYMVPSPAILAEMYQKAVVKDQSYDASYKDKETGDKSTVVNFMQYTLPDGTVAEWPFSGCKWGSNGGNCDNNERDICACWSNSTITSYEQDGANAYCFVYRYKSEPWSTVQNGNRAHGYPVRCMKDESNR